MLKAIRRLFKKSKNIEATSDYQKWRDGIFSIIGEQVGVSSNQPDRVYGLLMDVGLANDDGTPADKNLVITESAFSSGEASLKTTFGGGVIGLGGSKEVSEHAKQIIGLAQALVPLTEPATNHNVPMSGRIYFYFLTTSGVRLYRCGIKEIDTQGHPFNEIFARFTLIKRQADEIMAKYSKQ